MTMLIKRLLDCGCASITDGDKPANAKRTISRCYIHPGKHKIIAVSIQQDNRITGGKVFPETILIKSNIQESGKRIINYPPGKIEQLKTIK